MNILIFKPVWVNFTLWVQSIFIFVVVDEIEHTGSKLLENIKLVYANNFFF